MSNNNKDLSATLVLGTTVFIVFILDYVAGFAYIAVLSVAWLAIVLMRTINCYRCEQIRRRYKSWQKNR